MNVIIKKKMFMVEKCWVKSNFLLNFSDHSVNEFYSLKK